MKSHKVAMLTSACALGLMLSTQVLAQEAQPAEDDVVEVVITATKKRESLQTVPSSVDVVTAQTIEKMNIQTFQDVEKVSPGLQLNASGGRAQNISLRGVSFDPDTGASPTVQVYWNETPISTSTAFRGLFDVGQIEVLKGPQGTLRGQTSPAGAITIATKRPNLNFAEGTLNQTIGSGEKVNTQLAGNIPLIEGKLALRVAALYDYSEDGVKNVTNGRVNSDMTHGARASLLYKPTNDLEILLVHQDMNNRLVNYRTVVGSPLVADGQAAGQTITARDRLAVAEGDSDFYNHSRLTSLNVTWDVAGHRLSYIGGYQETKDTAQRDQDLTNVITGFVNQQNLEVKSLQTTHEVRFESVGNTFWNYMVGAYYSRGTTDLELDQPLPYFFFSPYQPPLYATMTGYSRPGGYGKGMAFFTNHRFALSEKDQLELGLRWQKNESDFQQYINIFGYEMPSVPEDQTYRETKAWTGSASYKRTFSRDVMAYVSYGRGLRPGGITGFVTAPGLTSDHIIYPDETTDAYEIGIKSRWFDRRLTLNASLFRQDVKNYIARANGVYVRVAAQPGEADGPGAGGSYPYDAGTGPINLNTYGDVKSTGIEITTSWIIRDNWSAQLNLSYVDAHYVNAMLYCNDTNNDGVPDQINAPSVQPGRQVSLCLNNGAIADMNGNLPGKLNASLQSEYSKNIGTYDVFVRGLVRYIPPATNIRTSQEISAFTPVDLYVGLRPVNQNWELSFWAQNLFDQQRDSVEVAHYVGSVAGGYRAILLPEERRVGVTLRYNFGQ